MASTRVLATEKIKKGHEANVGIRHAVAVPRASHENERFLYSRRKKGKDDAVTGECREGRVHKKSNERTWK